MGRRTPSFEARRWLGDLAITQKVKTNEISRRTPTIRRFFGISAWNPNVGSCGRCFKEPNRTPPTIGLWNRTDRTYDRAYARPLMDFMALSSPTGGHSPSFSFGTPHGSVSHRGPKRAEAVVPPVRERVRERDGRVERAGSPGWTPRHRSVGVDLKNLLDFDL